MSKNKGRSSPGQSKSTIDAHSPQANRNSGQSRILALAVISSLLLVLAFPPLNFYPIAWIAPIGWLVVCQIEQPIGRRGYFQLWLSGCLFWLVCLHSVRLAFWLLYIGWFALSFYLAIYIPLWVGVTRWLVHRWRVPLAIAAPVCWTGFELIRSHFLTGYAANTLAHSQAWQPYLIQFADTIGHGGIGFLMMAFAGLITQVATSFLKTRLKGTSIGNALEGTLDRGLPKSKPTDPSQAQSPEASLESSGPTSLNVLSVGLQVVFALAIPSALLCYGSWRIVQAERSDQKTLLRCLLLQENTPSIFEMNPDANEYQDRVRSAWTSYANLSREAARELQQLDLVVWPESSFTALEPYTVVDFEAGQLPGWLRNEIRKEDVSVDELNRGLARLQRNFELKVKVALLASRGMEVIADLPDSSGPDLLVGCDAAFYTSERLKRHAGALWIGSDGKIRGSYAKMHLVMFGEYIPLRPILGWMESYFISSADAGVEPKSFKIKDVEVAPNICFETMVPRLIVWQVQQLTASGHSPDVLVNLTNDSWFKGTSMLDHHLASTILCAVENRRPILVAANTGLSAHIDGCGRLVNCSQRLTVQTILAEPKKDGRWGLVQSLGYPLSWCCAVMTLIAMISQWTDRWRRKSPD